MTQSLTRRRAHLALLAALLALAAALFVAWPSAGAADKGTCLKEGRPFLEMMVGDTCTIVTANTHLLQHANITDRLFAEMSGGAYVSGADGTAGGNSSTMKNFTADGDKVTVTALHAGEVVITDTNEAAGASSVADEKSYIRVINDNGGISQGVCSADKDVTSYLLVGDNCMLHTKSGADLKHEVADSETLADSKAVAELVAKAGGITFGSYDTGEDANPANFSVATAYGYGADWLETFTARPAILLKAKGVGKTQIGPHNIEVLAAPMFELFFLNDSDGIVKAGTPVRVGIRTRAVVRGVGWPTTSLPDNSGDPKKNNWKFGTAAGSFSGHWEIELSVPSLGLSFAQSTDQYPLPAGGAPITNDNWGTNRINWSPDVKKGFEGSTQRYKLEMADSGPSTTEYQNFNLNTNRVWYLLTDGAPAGEYTITAKVLRSNLRPEKVGRLSVGDTATTTLTIAEDAGQGVGSATLSVKPGESASAMKNKSINLVVSVKNSLGNKTSDKDVTDIIVTAPGAEVGGEPDSKRFEDDDATASKGFAVTRDKPGTVDVKVTVVGDGGSVTTETLTLTFTGDAKSIVVGEASNRLADDKTADDEKNLIKFDVTAQDASGNAAEVKKPQLSTALKDAAGKTAKNLKATAEQAKVSTADDAKADPKKVVVTVKVEPGKATPGTYTLEVTLNNAASSKQTAEFVVAGKTETIAAEADKTELSVGEVVEITATLTDKDGHQVKDNLDVTFTAAGALKLSALGGDKVNAVTAKTKDGQATAQFVVTDGSGAAVVIVSEGTASTTVSLSSQATAAASADAAPTLSCLNNLVGFATWTCESDAKASEVFNLVGGRGASAVHLWNGSAWVSYSVVDGQSVPGSNDFMLKQFDNIYISN